MDKVDDETSPQKATTISFADDTKQEVSVSVQVEEDDPECMDDWEQRTSEPYTSMKVDVGYLKKKSTVTANLCKATAIGITVFSIASVWVLMALPTLCHFQVICHAQSQVATTMTTTPQNRSNCSGYEYLNGVCSQYIPSCSSSGIPLTNFEKNDTTETILATVFSYLAQQQSSCSMESEVVRRFICEYAYQPCNIEGMTYIPPRNVCEYIRDEACMEEYTSLARTGAFDYLLPDCNILEKNLTDLTGCKVDLGVVQPTSANTGSSTPSTNNTSECAAIPYTGSVCSSHLQTCGSPITTHLSNQNTELILGVVSNQISMPGAEPSCAQASGIVLEFLCRQFYKPCDDVKNVIQPNRSTCELLRDQLCQSTWIQYQQFLPNCSDLEESVILPTCNNSVGSSPPVITLNLTCNSELGFKEINGSCQPLCSEWKGFSEFFSDLTDGMILSFTLVGLLGGVAVVFFSVVRYDKVMKFPTVFIVYLTLILMVLGLTVLVQYIGRFDLSCTPDDNLLNTIANPTQFCSASGFIFYYFLISATWFWLAHVTSTFWKVMWPFKARELEDKYIYIHITLLVIGLILPLGSPLAAYFIDGFSYSRFPPLLCVAQNQDVTYYAIILPVCIAVAVGMTQLILILHVLQQKQRLFKFRKNKTNYWLGLSTAEKKIILIFLYYILLASVDLIAFSITSTFLNDLITAITNNFACELFRTDPNVTCPRDFESIRLTEGFSILTFFLLGMFPFVNLLFAINIAEVKSKFKNWCSRYDSRERTASTSLKSARAPDSPPFSLRRNRSYSLNTKEPVNTKQIGTVGKSGKFHQHISKV